MLNGAEYFFAPKISISGEFYYGFYYMNSGDGIMESESWDLTDNQIKKSTRKTAGERFFGFDNSITGAININFYF